ncbi:MAG: chemotaxis protein CheW [Pseudomonadales bacterium]
MAHYLHFESSLGSRLVNVSDVVEVIPLVALQPQGSEDPLFCGLLNYRGQIVPVFDLSASSQERLHDAQSFLIVAQCENQGIAFLAKEVNSIIDVAPELISEIRPANSPMFHVAKWADDILRIVEPREFIG